MRLVSDHMKKILIIPSLEKMIELLKLANSGDMDEFKHEYWKNTQKEARPVVLRVLPSPSQMANS